MSDDEIKCWKEITGGLKYPTDIHIPRFVGNGPTVLQEHHQWHCQFTLLKGTKCTRKENTYHTKTQIFVNINWCRKSSICCKGNGN